MLCIVDAPSARLPGKRQGENTLLLNEARKETELRAFFAGGVAFGLMKKQETP